MRLGRKQPAHPPEEPQRVPRKDRRGASPFLVGALALLVIALATYVGFAKHIPLTHGFRVRAVFESANSIRPNSPVRIAGVNVGKVKAIAREPGTNAAVVTMEIDDKGLPIHKDATVRIRPRIFLEGNFFVDLQPGTPATPTIDDGDTLPVSQTAAPVQLDQVLTALQQDTRSDLQRLVKSLATALTYKPSPASDAAADPLARGESAAESLNDSIRYGRVALRGTAEVTDAFTGTRPHDLSRLIRGLQRTTEGLSRDEGTLQELVRNLDTTLAATASEAQSLGLTIRRLPTTLAAADGALDSLNAAFPNTRAFAREILPGVRETGPTIDAAFPWVAQTRALLGPDELQGLVRELSPATSDLARVADASVDLFPQADLAAKCLTRVVLPTGNVKIQDGPLSTGVENFKEFWYAMVGLAGEGQNVDGNGMYVRFQPGGGDQTVSLGPAGGNAGDRLFGNAVIKPLGTRPRFPGRRPPYRPDVPCFTNTLPDLNAAGFGPADGATP
jgi:phospholipid/cholesterol/gamma-HCH transport system substrate-binding protein